MKLLHIASMIGIASIWVTSIYASDGIAPPINLSSSASASRDTEVIIRLTSNGFSPKAVTIAQGDTVSFTNETGRYFWPASDSHPDHTVYPAFDPKEPLAPDTTWSFTFDKSGTWGFHDHISPRYGGTITVTVGNEGAASTYQLIGKRIVLFYKDIKEKLNRFITHNFAVLNYKKCQGPTLERSQRVGCWEEIVIALVQTKGLNAALSFISRQKEHDLSFAADCHVYVHRVGEEYYWQFIQHRNVEVSDKFSMCDLGFFHGFMQEFTSHGQSLREAKRYCDIVSSRIKNGEFPTVLQHQCYHGIGHGLTFMYAAQYWGQNDKIIDLGIADCKKLTEEPRECINGVYGGLAAMFWGLHGFTIEYRPDDPFFICANQKQPDATGCYNMFVPVVFGEMNQDLVKTGKILEQIPDEEIQRITMEHAGSMPSYTLVPKTNDYSQIIHACREFRDPLSSWCLRGFSAAIVRIGKLDEAKKRSSSFCYSSLMTKEEQDVCYLGVVEQLAYRFSQKEADQFCEDVSKQYGIHPCESAK
jgi:plastocyanin